MPLKIYNLTNIGMSIDWSTKVREPASRLKVSVLPDQKEKKRGTSQPNHRERRVKAPRFSRKPARSICGRVTFPEP